MRFIKKIIDLAKRGKRTKRKRKQKIQIIKTEKKKPEKIPSCLKRISINLI